MMDLSTPRLTPASLLCLLVLCAACSSPDEPNANADPPVVILLPDSGGEDAAPDLVTPEPDQAVEPDLATEPTDLGDMGEDADMGDLSGGDMAEVLPNRCVAGATWTPATPTFVNRTTESGLEALAADGVRISAVDLDGDGLADLAIRRASNQAREHSFEADGVRQVWLLRNKGDGTFEEMTASSGLLARRDGRTDVGRPAEIIVFADVDQDGDLDAVTLFSNSDPSALNSETAEVMRNRGDGTFEFALAESDPLRVRGRAYSRGGASFTDVNRDGRIDLWIGSGGPGQDLLYLATPEGGFRDATAELGLGTAEWQRLADLNSARAHTNSWGVNACDLNNDGSPELLSASYGRSPNHLWRAGRGLTGLSYSNASIASGYAFDDRIDWSDNESARCHCKLNPDDPGCAGVPTSTRIRCAAQQDAFRWGHEFDRDAFRLGGNSGTTVCADLNNDGWLDLLTTEIVHWDVGSSSDPSELLYNAQSPEVLLTRPGNEVTGLLRTRSSQTWDDGDITAAVFDFDNDGRLDVYLGSTDYPGTRGLLFHQRADGTFEPVLWDVGIDHSSSHGIGVADFDGDGDLDVVVGHSRGRCSSGAHCYERGHARYFENVFGAQNNWVRFELEGGEGSNRAAIGARVELSAGELTQLRTIDGGHGHYGIQHELVAHFGLGSSCEATVTITWPDQALTQQTFTVQAGYRYTVRQGEAPIAQR